ncbi:MAG TPA: aldehyde dehydrogenase [Baekduia sp.]|nr:aldehyde dehydrogenase [Baekduia sp.]
MSEAPTIAERAPIERDEEVRRLRHVIGGELVDAADGKTFESFDPHTGKVWATVAEGGAEDVRRAVAAARKAFEDGGWSRLPTAERRRLLNRLADGIAERAEEMAIAETRDMGKPYRESRHADLPRAEGNFRFFGDFQHFATAETFPAHQHHTYTRYEPKGVVAAISPWNFPLMLASWKVAPALAFGNTVVLKPAEQSPATATILGEIAAEVLPPGVLNIVHGFGPDAAGEHLVASPSVDVVTFTGETRTGTAVMANASPTLKGLSLEMGGKSPNIVFADADMDAAVAGALRAIFMNNGEVCLAGSRLLVERAIYDEFLERLVERTAALAVGDPLDPETMVGPVVSVEQRERVLRYVGIGAEEGRVRIGGGVPERAELAGGYYVEPTIIDQLSHDSRCVTEEIFGPVLVAEAFDTEEQAVQLANDSEYGLAGMVWTTNLNRAHRVAQALECGLVWVNCFFVRDLRTPFGGAKRSGVGREGGYHSREFFTEPKTVTIELS